MPYKSKEIRHLKKQEEARGRRKPVRDLDEIEQEKRFKKDVTDLLRSVNSRAEFVRELEKVTARHGRQIAPEQYKRILQAFDEFWRGRKTPGRP